MIEKMLIKSKFDRVKYCERMVKSGINIMKRFWILMQ